MSHRYEDFIESRARNPVPPDRREELLEKLKSEPPLIANTADSRGTRMNEDNEKTIVPDEYYPKAQGEYQVKIQYDTEDSREIRTFDQAVAGVTELDAVARAMRDIMQFHGAQPVDKIYYVEAK